MGREDAEARLRESIRKGREERGLSTDLSELVETYRALDPEYAEKLGRLLEFRTSEDGGLYKTSW